MSWLSELYPVIWKLECLHIYWLQTSINPADQNRTRQSRQTEFQSVHSLRLLPEWGLQLWKLPSTGSGLVWLANSLSLHYFAPCLPPHAARPSERQGPFYRRKTVHSIRIRAFMVLTCIPIEMPQLIKIVKPFVKELADVRLLAHLIRNITTFIRIRKKKRLKMHRF